MNHKSNKKALVRKQNCSSFTSLRFRALARGGLEMCCNVGWVPFLFFAGGKKKNKINFSNTATTCPRAKFRFKYSNSPPVCCQSGIFTLTYN
jgi:hypothetical protein